MRRKLEDRLADGEPVRVRSRTRRNALIAFCETRGIDLEIGYSRIGRVWTIRPRKKN